MKNKPEKIIHEGDKGFTPALVEFVCGDDGILQITMMYMKHTVVTVNGAKIIMENGLTINIEEVQ